MTPLQQETRKLRARYDEEPSHSDQVTRLALQLFDALRSWHRLDDRTRELLESAALLHDIGWSQTPDGKGHHKQSARLIHQHDWKWLEDAEVELVAQVARYHRKTKPLPTHAAFHALSSADQRLVMVLGGILRLADALDRTHSDRIQAVAASVTPESLLIQVDPRGRWETELAMFEVKKDMLEETAGRRVSCSALSKP
jgi:exopolyphosphatase/guanosine-5'-triphosphate,3'-diphosphate pyrophosphatase